MLWGGVHHWVCVGFQSLQPSRLTSGLSSLIVCGGNITNWIPTPAATSHYSLSPGITSPDKLSQATFHGVLPQQLKETKA